MALADNRAKIQALLDGINALPEAGSGEPADPVLQEKSVTPTKAAQAVTPDTGYDGLSKVDVGAIPDEYIVPSGTVSITENGTHDVREAESVNVNVDAPEIALQEKTVAPTTSAQTVTPDSGYDGLSKVTVNAMPTATQATPSIEVSSGGLITAKATQTAGYVAEGTKQATKQLTVQGAQTITPGTADKTIAAGRYLTGTQTIKGDANLLPANIKSGVSIFGVAGTLEEGSGGGSGVTPTNCTVTVKVINNCTNTNGISADVMYGTVTEDGNIEYAWDFWNMLHSDAEFEYKCAYGSYLMILHNRAIENFSCTGCYEGLLDSKMFTVEMELSKATVKLTFVDAE